jgi:hypothetical protein
MQGPWGPCRTSTMYMVSTGWRGIKPWMGTWGPQTPLSGTDQPAFLGKQLKAQGVIYGYSESTRKHYCFPQRPIRALHFQMHDPIQILTQSYCPHHNPLHFPMHDSIITLTQSFTFTKVWAYCIRHNPSHFQTPSMPTPSQSHFLKRRPAMDSPDHSGHFQLFRFLWDALLTSPVTNQCFTFPNAWTYCPGHNSFAFSNAWLHYNIDTILYTYKCVTLFVDTILCIFKRLATILCIFKHLQFQCRPRAIFWGVDPQWLAIAVIFCYSDSPRKHY